MNDTNDKRRRLARWGGAAALVAAGVAGGGVLATSLSAQAADTSSSSSSSSSSPSGSNPSAGSSTTPPSSARSMPAPGSAAHEDAEKPVTGTAATKAKAAALKSVGSGTAGEVTTDFTGDGYEVTVTKSDGSTVEVHLDSSFQVRDHGGPGGPGGHGDGDRAPGNAPGAPPGTASGTAPAPAA